MDISNSAAVDEVFATINPEAVINCAAYTDVDGAESNAEACYAANSTGVENLAASAKTHGAAFVTISTDYVFGGEKRGFYLESDTPDPLGVYGMAKYEGERRAKAANPDSMIVRSGWIYGTGGTNFLSKMHLFLAEGKRIKAIADSYGTPTYANDLAKRLRELAGVNRGGVYHVTNSGPGTSYAGFAQKVAEIGGYDPSLIELVSADSMQRPAPRPQSSKLGTTVLDQVNLDPLPDWEKALQKFLLTNN